MCVDLVALPAEPVVAPPLLFCLVRLSAILGLWIYGFQMEYLPEILRHVGKGHSNKACGRGDLYFFLVEYH